MARRNGSVMALREAGVVVIWECWPVAAPCSKLARRSGPSAAVPSPGRASTARSWTAKVSDDGWQIDRALATWITVLRQRFRAI